MSMKLGPDKSGYGHVKVDLVVPTGIGGVRRPRGWRAGVAVPLDPVDVTLELVAPQRARVAPDGENGIARGDGVPRVDLAGRRVVGLVRLGAVPLPRPPLTGPVAVGPLV